MRRRGLIAVAALLIALLLGAYGDMLHQQEEEAQYCRMVAAGHWPDYKRQFDRVCPPPKAAPTGADLAPQR